ncbi:MAG TPA: M48 family metalloprotease [Allosphingosinicella sp.]|jgi:predicted Zn-dependent protease
MLRRALLLAALFSSALAGCGKEPEEYRPEIKESERQLGAEQHPQLLAEFGGSYDASEAAYLKRIGEKLAGTAGLGGQCTFTLVNSDVVNAFAVPGCYIYVTRGLMGIVNSEAELASVLAHELGHIVGAHSARQQKRSLWRQLGVLAVGMVTGSEGLTRLAGNAAQYFTLRYSRKQEYESDDLGLLYLRRAGYDPYAASDMLAALARNEQYTARTRGRDEAKGVPEWARTHPLTEHRIERSRSAAAATGLGEDDLPENEAGFLREVDGLLYGDDPAQGFVLGRRFVHPVMRIGFEAPQGFTLTNSRQAILIEGPDGMRGEFGGGRMPPGGLEDYVSGVVEQSLRGAPVQAGTPEPIRANGVPGVILPLLVQTQQADLQLTIAAFDPGDGQAFHFLMASRPLPDLSVLRSLFGSFRTVSREEAARLRPRQIRVVAAGAGDDVETIASRMVSDHPREHFLMLNGRSPDQPLRAGERVKIVRWAGD